MDMPSFPQPAQKPKPESGFIDKGSRCIYNHHSIFEVEGYKCHETDLPAEQQKTEADPRFSCPYAFRRRPKGIEQTTREGKTSIDRLMPAGRDESFSRKHRLHNSSDFKRIFSRGKRIATPYFVIYCLPNHLDFSRLGIQVKAKIGTAVRRNYLKRITREAFRRIKLDFREPVDLIFIAEKAMNGLDYDQFQREFAMALRKYLR